MAKKKFVDQGLKMGVTEIFTEAAIHTTKSKKSEFWGIKKTVWRRLILVAISAYVGWSWAKISDQNKIIDLQRNVLAASSTVDPK